MLGVHTDGTSFVLPETRERAEQRQQLEAALRRWVYPDGNPMFAMKPLPVNDITGRQKRHLVPCCRQKPMAPLTEPMRPAPRMKRLGEHDVFQEFAATFGSELAGLPRTS